MNKKRVFNLLIICLFLVLTMSIFGCGKDDKKPSQLTPLLQDLSDWDNTTTRLKKRQETIVIPVINQIESFSKLEEQEKHDKASEYLLKINKLAEALPNSNDVIKKESRYTEYANRYVESARALLAAYKNKQNTKDAAILTAMQRDLFDVNLGLENAYAIAQGKPGTYNFTRDAFAKIKSGMTYDEIIKILRMPALRSNNYVLYGDKTNTVIELCVWTLDDKTVTIKFKDGIASEIKSNGL